jgi:hypothetical protein
VVATAVAAMARALAAVLRARAVPVRMVRMVPLGGSWAEARERARQDREEYEARVAATRRPKSPARQVLDQLPGRTAALLYDRWRRKAGAPQSPARQAAPAASTLQQLVVAEDLARSSQRALLAVVAAAEDQAPRGPRRRDSAGRRRRGRAEAWSSSQRATAPASPPRARSRSATRSASAGSRGRSLSPAGPSAPSAGPAIVPPPVPSVSLGRPVPPGTNSYAVRRDLHDAHVTLTEALARGMIVLEPPARRSPHRAGGSVGRATASAASPHARAPPQPPAAQVQAEALAPLLLLPPHVFSHSASLTASLTASTQPRFVVRDPSAAADTRPHHAARHSSPRAGGGGGGGSSNALFASSASTSASSARLRLHASQRSAASDASWWTRAGPLSPFSPLHTGSSAGPTGLVASSVRARKDNVVHVDHLLQAAAARRRA